ncbi:hypothetical protein B0T21DRAFT_346593 [Apiosordaria backusii]|uniref:Cholesterol oxidase n=1 Tax=Apiosordaria backusii TaxID=314023 RepID=A0AA40EIP8_9PEZI|nr:hypothetical protein B0T21DRAFT_346593 [Apiosordaria backusii]
MDKSGSQNPSEMLGVHPNGPNGPYTPPLTPALTIDSPGNSPDNRGQLSIDHLHIVHSPADLTHDSVRNVTETEASLRQRRVRTADSESSNSTEAAMSSSSSSPNPRAASVFSTQTLISEETALPRATTPSRQDSHPIETYDGHQQDPSPHSTSRARIRGYTDGRDDKAFPRISKPLELLRGSYDVVVIGSGYGGGVAASRMARTGQSVCVLERGREKWPGEYPTGAVEAFKELHYSGQLAPAFLKGKLVEGGNPTGMYHMIFGKGQNAVVCNGLGGTSLINANVFMEADKETLSMKAWPKEIREDPKGLDKYYKKVEKVLEPTEYPSEWPELPKTKVFREQAETLGMGHKFKKVRQTTRFRNGPNSCGVEMSPSSLTGQDATGVNDGSKTTTLVTYLADAWNWGAEMFCECEVRYIQKDEKEGYRVFFAWHGRNRGLFKGYLHNDLMWVHAKQAVFLGAGAIASTEILLRSKAMGLSMSDQVGQNMSGNGDMLAFGYNTDRHVNGMGKPVPSPYNPIGPTITSVIDNRDGHENPLDGYVIEEGAIPHALTHLFQVMMDFMPGKKDPKDDSIIEKTQAALARWGSRLLGPYFKNGATERTQVYLVMSHDSNQAMLSLKDDKPVLEFLGVARSHHVKKLNSILERATEYVGGTLVHSPFYGIMGQQITVHPIGGACMARDNTGRTGVTNHIGQLFTGNGEEVHDGFVVTDASVIPTALGANPFATIAALAERSVEAYCESKDLKISTEKNGILNLLGEPAHPPKRCRPKQKREQLKVEEELISINTAKKVMDKARIVKASGIGFTEVMSGFLHADKNMTEDNRATYELAHRIGKSLCESARFFLSVQAFNTKEMISHVQHRGMLTGTFVCPAIHGSPFMVQRGEFNLFILNSKAPGTRNLTYDFDMTGVDGRRLHFHGYKVVDSSVALAPLQFWKATSTLYVTISEHVPGMCRDLDDEDAWRRGAPIAKGIMQIQPSDFLSQINTMTTTGSNLFRKAISAASFLTRQSQRPLHDPGSIRRPPNLRPPHHPYNAVNYFRRAGYRVWVSVHRIGQLMIAGNNWTTFDARLDLRASHCMGSVAFSSGLLDGTIPASWILGISCSQVFMNPIWGPANMAKVMAGGPLPLDKLYNSLCGSWFSCSTSKDEGWTQYFLNQLLRLYPQSRKEMCNNAACHRTSLVFGRCWNHHNLNEATHRQIDRFFGGVNMRLLNLLMKMGYEGHVMTNAPMYEPLDTRENIQRLKGIPIMLWVGRDNAVLSPRQLNERTRCCAASLRTGITNAKWFPGMGTWTGGWGGTRGGMCTRL